MRDWLDPLFDTAEMRAADAWAIEEQGVPSLDLMERAGVGLAVVTAAAARPGPVRVVVGKGNNGGDGLVVARLLREDGHEVDVFAAADPADLRGDARENLDRLPGAPPEPFAPERLEASGVVVDALLGTGFEGSPREPLASAIAAINAQEAPVVACDVPSGVNASTGEVEGEAVRATATATFHGPKIGLFVTPGKEHAGRVETVEIGIPRGAPGAGRAGLISERVLDLYPRRARSGTKFASGVVVVAGGSLGLTGAPTMAARSAERAGAVVLGPGLGRDEGALEFARGVAGRVEAPLLVDADGLNAHAGRLELFREREAPTVLTPHEGELGRLLERRSDDVARHRLACAREAAERSGAVVLLKGDDTIVALPGGEVAVNPGGSPALATAGTGDVLSGLIGALLAKGLEALEATCLRALAVVRDIMDTDPATVRPETPVEEVVSTLRRHELPGLPVVDGEGRVVGMITEADLVLPDDDGDLHIPHYINLFGGTIFLEPLSRFEQRLRKAFASNAADMMTADPDTVSPDTTVQEAARIIHESGHNRLPVVEDGRLVGVVTRVDVLGALAA